MILGVLHIGLATVFFSYGIKLVSAVTANLIALIEPVFNPVWVFLVLGETLTAKAYSGGSGHIGSVTASCLVTGWRTSR